MLKLSKHLVIPITLILPLPALTQYQEFKNPDKARLKNYSMQMYSLVPSSSQSVREISTFVNFSYQLPVFISPFRAVTLNTFRLSTPY